MVESKLGHRKVLRVSRRETCADADRGCGDQAVGLAERHTAGCEVATPTSGELSLLPTERRDAEPGQQAVDGGLLGRSASAPELFRVHSADIGRRLYPSERAKTLGGSSSAQHVDEDGRVEKKRHSADAALIGMPLTANPCRSIVVPAVALCCDRAKRRLDLVPPALVIERVTDRLGNEAAASPPADPSVELRHERLVEHNV